MLMPDIPTPKEVINRIGFMLNEVIPSNANASIFFNGYLLSPANLSARSYSTVVHVYPTCGTIPLKNTFTSLN